MAYPKTIMTERDQSNQSQEILLPEVDIIYDKFDKLNLLGNYEAADTFYTSLAGFLSGQKFTPKKLTVFFILAVQEEKKLPDYQPEAASFVMAHFDEFITAVMPDEVSASTAKAFMRQLQQAEMLRRLSIPPSQN